MTTVHRLTRIYQLSRMSRVSVVNNDSSVLSVHKGFWCVYSLFPEIWIAGGSTVECIDYLE